MKLWLLALVSLMLMIHCEAVSILSKYFNVLGLKSDADESSIKAAYRKLAMKYHPDRNRGKAKETEKKFKEINEAYEILSDPKKRKDLELGENDRQAFGSSPFSQYSNQQFSPSPSMFTTSSNPFGSSSDINDLMEQLMGGLFSSQSFGSRGGHPADSFNFQPEPTTKAPLIMSLRLSLKDLISCRKKRLRVSNYIRIGTSLQKVSHIFEVDIKPGWRSGTRITFPPSAEFPQAVAFVVEEVKDERFERSGSDLILRVPAASVAIGRELKIVLPWTDNAMSVSITAEDLRSGRKVMAGLGMPSKGGSRGDLLLMFTK